MKEKLLQRANYWWEKLKPLRINFCLETYIAGYEKDDIEQECYLILLKALEKYDTCYQISFGYYYKLQLKGWRSNMNKRTQCKSYARVGNGLVDEEQIDETLNLEELIMEKMKHKVLYELLQGLEQVDRQIIVDYYMVYKPIKVIAEEQGLDYKQVEYRKSKVLKRLRKQLSNKV